MAGGRRRRCLSVGGVQALLVRLCIHVDSQRHDAVVARQAAEARASAAQRELLELRQRLQHLRLQQQQQEQALPPSSRRADTMQPHGVYGRSPFQ
eukprot:COSAG01_NODE_3826_length_5656_cov_12.085478_4_plen_95_part_00